MAEEFEPVLETSPATATLPGGLSWSRFFTRAGTHPFDAIPRNTRSAVITNPDGSEVFRQDNIEAPVAWSDLAVRIVAQKYFTKGSNPETSVFDMVKGVANAIAVSGWKQGYFCTQGDADAFEAELAFLLINQYGAFNSPVWFNVRRWERGYVGAGGSWAWDEKTQSAHVTTNAYQRPQCSACFIQPIDDSLVGPGGIYDFAESEARLFKGGSGSGANFSRIREKYAPLSAGGVSSGLMAFLPPLDCFAGAIKSGGTTRRAAKMVILNADHPEIEAFVAWKTREEKKMQVLVAAGYSAGMEGEAATTVSGQNANNSVRVSDGFMRAVEQDGPWELTSRVGGHVVKTIRAKDLWHQIAEASWFCADPGLQFDDTINNWNTTPNAGWLNGTNPCSEYVHLDDSACNLASLRLTKFLLPDGSFGVASYMAACKTFIVAQDILVDFASYPTKKIAEGAHKFRQLGLGYADLGALLMQVGLGYSERRAHHFAGALTSLMSACAYEMSGELAKALEPFDGFQADKEGVRHIIHKHLSASSKLAQLCDVGQDSLALPVLHAAQASWYRASELAAKKGIRNAQVTLLAPTGTIGFLMDCDTTGVEPLLGHVQTKKLAGGGTLKIVNAGLETTLTRLGYRGPAIPQIVEHVKNTGGFVGSLLEPKHLPIFDTAFPSGTDGRHLAPAAHIEMMAAVQPFLSGAISKTINLPETATVEDIENIHMQAWKLGLKAVALYRNGSKGAQPVSSKSGPEEKKPETLDPVLHPKTDPEFKRVQRKLPKVRNGKTWALKLDNHKIYLRSGEYPDGSVGEIFVDIAKEGSTLSGLLGMWAKSVSLGLQYGVPLDEFIETFTHTKFEPYGMVANHETIKMASSLVDLVMRVLGVEYAGRTDLQQIQPEMLEINTIPPTITTKPLSADGPPCPTCGTITLRNASCHRCPQCGLSLGCS